MKVQLLGILLLMLAVGTVSAMLSITQTQNAESGINYHSQVCIEKNDDLVGCSHNLLMDDGRDMIRDLMIGSKTGTIGYIALCNSSNSTADVNGDNCAYPTISDVALKGEIVGRCGLGRATAGVSNAGTSNITLSYTFTSTCDNILINKTALYNISAGCSGADHCMFAANNFTTVTLQTNDQLTVTWYVWVT
jgi:hypothetical protein